MGEGPRCGMSHWLVWYNLVNMEFGVMLPSDRKHILRSYFSLMWRRALDDPEGTCGSRGARSIASARRAYLHSVGVASDRITKLR